MKSYHVFISFVFGILLILSLSACGANSTGAAGTTPAVTQSSGTLTPSPSLGAGSSPSSNSGSSSSNSNSSSSSGTGSSSSSNSNSSASGNGQSGGNQAQGGQSANASSGSSSSSCPTPVSTDDVQAVLQQAAGVAETVLSTLQADYQSGSSVLVEDAEKLEQSTLSQLDCLWSDAISIAGTGSPLAATITAHQTFLTLMQQDASMFEYDVSGQEYYYVVFTAEALVNQELNAVGEVILNIGNKSQCVAQANADTAYFTARDSEISGFPAYLANMQATVQNDANNVAAYLALVSSSYNVYNQMLDECAAAPPIPSACDQITGTYQVYLGYLQAAQDWNQAEANDSAAINTAMGYGYFVSELNGAYFAYSQQAGSLGTLCSFDQVFATVGNSFSAVLPVLWGEFGKMTTVLAAQVDLARLSGIAAQISCDQLNTDGQAGAVSCTHTY